jgi:hypothetical protein
MRKPDRTCEGCVSFRRLGGYYSARRERTEDSGKAEPLIPAKVGMCATGRGCGVCSCGRYFEALDVGGFVVCDCGLRVRMEPQTYVLPWGAACERWKAARLVLARR